MKNNLWQSSWQLIKPYWQSEEKWSAIWRLVVILVFSTGLVRLQVFANDLVKNIYDAIQKFDVKEITHYVLIYIGLIVIFAAAAAIQGYIFGNLTNRWRRWLTYQFLDKWLDKQAYYRMNITGQTVDNPDQRIADDIDSLTSTTLSLFVGLLTAILQVCTFSIIVWQLGGTLKFTALNHHFHIPGYLFWSVLSYAIINTLVTMIIGKRLAGLNYNQQHYNANFRFSLMRLREYGEQVAMFQGEKNERKQFEKTYQPIFSNFISILVVARNLTFFTQTTNLFASIIGVLIALPIFVQTHASIGSLMQMSSSFGYEYDALSFIISSYATIAGWRAVIFRLAEFSSKINLAVEASEHSQLAIQQNDYLSLQAINLHLPNGQLLQKELTWKILPGEAVLIKGPSGSGKSTVLKLLAKLWPFAAGTLTVPSDNSMFLSQKPYFPPLALMESICFPAAVNDFSQQQIEHYLQELNLAALIPLLNQTRNWHHELSLGEQQKLAIIRALLHRPKWLFLDEATASLDVESENKVYQLLKKELPNTTIISIGHRQSLDCFHDRIIEMSPL